MYVNENGEYVTVRSGKDEAGAYIEYRTYQDNGWIRINREYNHCTTETFERE